MTTPKKIFKDVFEITDYVQLEKIESVANISVPVYVNIIMEFSSQAKTYVSF